MDWVFVEGSTKEVAAAIDGTDVFSFDLETSGLEPHDSRILLAQIGIPYKQKFVLRTATADFKSLLPYLSSPRWTKLIHNAKFEQSFVQHYHDTFIRGAFDTMLAEQVINSDKNPRSLASVTEKYTGIILDKSQQTSFVGMHPMAMFTDDQLAYAIRDVEDSLYEVYLKQKQALEESGQMWIANIEFEAAGVVAAMELTGLPINIGMWREKLAEYRVRERASKDMLLDLFFGNSDMPEQVGMFERDGIVPSKNKKAVSIIDSPQNVGEAFHAIGIELPRNPKTNNYMTDERTLEQVDHPAAKELLNYRGITKVIDSYGESLLAKVHPFTGRLHPDFQQIGAETGRFSCREPNVQQIPEEFRKFIGGVDDWAVVGADYSQMELRIIAELSQDAALIKAFGLGDDPHASTAAVMFNVPIDKVTKEQRHIAKTINFGLSYGMGPNKLRDTLNATREKKLTIQEVYRLNDKYRETYRGVIEWFRIAGEKAYRQGSSTTLGGRKRYFERPTAQDADGFQKQVAAIKRQGGNSPIQGTNADITKSALVAVQYELMQYGFRASVMNTVHDEIVLLAHKTQAELVRQIVVDSMIRAAEELIKSVPVKVDSYISDWWNKG